MSGRATRTAATLLAVLGCGAALSGQQAPQPPVVAVVLTDGKLLPLAARPSADWQLLPWPRHDAQDGQPGPLVPATPAAIPKDWYTPLPALPTAWRLQPINGNRVVIHSGGATRWQIASFDAVGFATDYVDPDPNRRSFDFNAGIAVSGDVDALPTRELDEGSPEWAHLVARHAKAFVSADRSEAKRRAVHMKGRSTVVATKELRGGDVSLYRVELDAKHAYEYFEVVVQRGTDLDGKHLNCPVASVEYHGLIELHGRTEIVRWVSTLPPTCSEPTGAREVIGALRGADGVQLVVEDSGDDWQTFAIVAPDLLALTPLRRPAARAPAPAVHSGPVGVKPILDAR